MLERSQRKPPRQQPVLSYGSGRLSLPFLLSFPPFPSLSLSLSPSRFIYLSISPFGAVAAASAFDKKKEIRSRFGYRRAVFEMSGRTKERPKQGRTSSWNRPYNRDSYRTRREGHAIYSFFGLVQANRRTNSTWQHLNGMLEKPLCGSSFACAPERFGAGPLPGLLLFLHFFFSYPRSASTTSAMVFLLTFTGGGRGRREGDHISNGLPRIDLGGYMNSCVGHEAKVGW